MPILAQLDLEELGTFYTLPKGDNDEQLLMICESAEQIL